MLQVLKIATISHSVADTFLYDGLTPSDRGHAKDVPFLAEHFLHHTFFELLSSKVQQSYQKGVKNQFLEKSDHLNEENFKILL